MKSKILYMAILCWICSSCSYSGGYDMGFDRMEFDLDYRQQEIISKAKSDLWIIKGLSINGDERSFLSDYGTSNKKEMEIDGELVKIVYTLEGKYDEESAWLDELKGKEWYSDPVKLTGEWFEITKPTGKKIKVSLKQNLTGKERKITVHVGDVNYFGKIDIIQRAK